MSISIRIRFVIVLILCFLLITECEGRVGRVIHRSAKSIRRAKSIRTTESMTTNGTLESQLKVMSHLLFSEYRYPLATTNLESVQNSNFLLPRYHTLNSSSEILDTFIVDFAAPYMADIISTLTPTSEYLSEDQSSILGDDASSISSFISSFYYFQTMVKTDVSTLQFHAQLCLEVNNGINPDPSCSQTTAALVIQQNAANLTETIPLLFHFDSLLSSVHQVQNSVNTFGTLLLTARREGPPTIDADLKLNIEQTYKKIIEDGKTLSAMVKAVVRMK